MKNQLYLSKDERQLFRESIADAKKLPQKNAVVHLPAKHKIKQMRVSRKLQEQSSASSYYFSDEYQPLLEEGHPTRYVRAGNNPIELKKLQLGRYSPDLFLDLHGLTKIQAKLALGSLIVACKRKHLRCACVIHGHGKDILKQHTPLWLAQHPDVLALHQAPKAWGGDAAILLLISLTNER